LDPLHARLVIAGALGALAVAAPNASAHAVVSPPVAQSGTLQYFTLSVPTEKEGATTTKIELDVPPGFAIDSYQPSPGWKRQVTAKGSGEDAVVSKVVWTGGKVPTEEDSVFGFNADGSKAQDYTFKVVQTYSDGSVVDWSGPESSDTPAPVVTSVKSLGGGSDDGGTSTLEILALIVAGIALVLAAVGLVSRTGGRALT
jgi:uncharacterized protein YcnI